MSVTNTRDTDRTTYKKRTTYKAGDGLSKPPRHTAGTPCRPRHHTSHSDVRSMTTTTFMSLLFTPPSQSSVCCWCGFTLITMWGGKRAPDPRPTWSHSCVITPVISVIISSREKEDRVLGRRFHSTMSGVWTCVTTRKRMLPVRQYKCLVFTR